MSDDNKESHNFDIFRDCVFESIVEKSTAKRTKSQKRRPSAIVGGRPGTPQKKKKNNKPTRPATIHDNPSGGAQQDDPADLADFSEYIANEIWPSLPPELRTLSYHAIVQVDTNLSDNWSLPLTLGVLEEVTSHVPPSVSDSLTSYGLITPPASDLQSFISSALSAYIGTTTTPPPKWIETRSSSCEICDRDWVPLTYHHLIPKQVHAKVLKRGWHDEQSLNSVAWLCRACHSFVHKMAGNEELAKEWFTVERICEREDVMRWAAWVGRVRWKKA